jgi:hypothetical protein
MDGPGPSPDGTTTLINNPHEIKHRELPSFCLVFLAAFGWFASHAVPSLYFGDSGELLAAIHTGGIPHPTGFPILLLLGYLPSQANTLAVNMVSSAAGALSIALIALWARRLLGGAVFFPTVCVLLGSSTLLLHSSMTRVYSLQLATFSAVLLCVSTYQPKPRWGLLFGFLLGFAATTHTLFLGALIYAWIMLWNNRKEWPALAPWISVGFFLSASLYLWIPLRAHLWPAVSWGRPSNFESLWNYLSQRQYSEKMMSRDALGTWLFFRSIARNFLIEWNPLTWLLALGGFVVLYRSARRKAWSILSVVLFNVILLYAYGHNQDLDILYRYFLPTYACAAVLAAAAVSFLWEKWARGNAQSLGMRLFLGALLLALFVFYPAHRWSDLSQASGCRSYLTNLLKPLPANATPILGGDNQVFPAAYGRYVLGLRPDLHFVEWEGTLFPEAFLLSHDPNQPATPAQLEERWYEQGGGCLFLAAPRMVQPPFHCRPFGFMYRLSDDTSEKTMPPPPAPYWLPPRYTNAERNDVEAAEPLADHYLMAAAWNKDRGNLDAALAAIEDAVQTTPHTVRTLINAAAQYGDNNLDARCEELLLQALQIQPNNFEILLNLGIHYGKIGRYADCRRYLLLADAQKPNQPIVLHFLNQLDAVTRGGK